MTRSEIITAFRQVHGDRYDYSLVKYVNYGTNVTVLCSKHGPFDQTPSNHLKGTKCPKCARDLKYAGAFRRKFKNKQEYYRALKRRQAGFTEDEILFEGYARSQRKINPISVYGVAYPNLEEAIRRLNPPASARSISRWISDGMTPEEAFAKVPNPGYEDGIIYLITHIESGRKYVGQTVQSLEARWLGHLEQAASGLIRSGDSLHEAIRIHGADAFEIGEVDRGVANEDLEDKERLWIDRLNTLAPRGFNILNGGGSGGSNKKPTEVDGRAFDSVAAAAEYVAETRSISIVAAKWRLRHNKVDVRTPAKPGQSWVKTKEYKAWRNIIDAALNPKSKDFIPGLDVDERWRNDFYAFLEEVGPAPKRDMALCRLDKTKGFHRGNCAWLTKSEASRMNAQQCTKNRPRTRGLRARKPRSRLP